MGPLIPLDIIADQWSNVAAILIGIAFGFVMEGSGFSSSRKMVGLYYGYDFTVLRVFMTAAVTAAIGMLYFDYLGWVDLSLIYIHPTYVNAAIVGGIFMGMGFVTGGYCPGTSTCGMGIGKIDAYVYTIGMVIGIFIFSEAFPLFESIYNGNYLGNITISEYINISPYLITLVFTIVALVVFYVTNIIRKKVKEVYY